MQPLSVLCHEICHDPEARYSQNAVLSGAEHSEQEKQQSLKSFRGTSEMLF